MRDFRVLTLPDVAEPTAPTWYLSTPLREAYAAAGVVVLSGAVPELLLADYERAYTAAGVAPRGWPSCTPYVEVPELRALCLSPEVAGPAEHLVGEGVLLHLCLTGWVSTERAWHQDTYLNPPEVGDAYIACWIALEDVHPDAGPFQYLPGSHRWPVLSRAAVFAELTPEQQQDSDWPKFTEAIVAPVWEAECERRGVVPWTFLAHRGDVLLWHPRLVHRGSPPRDAGRTRKALICHFSGVQHRQDMPIERRVRAGEGWWYQP